MTGSEKENKEISFHIEIDPPEILCKFNGGLGAILCNTCRTIIRTGPIDIPSEPAVPLFCSLECLCKYWKK